MTYTVKMRDDSEETITADRIEVTPAGDLLFKAGRNVDYIAAGTWARVKGTGPVKPDRPERTSRRK